MTWLWVAAMLAVPGRAVTYVRWIAHASQAVDHAFGCNRVTEATA